VIEHLQLCQFEFPKRGTPEWDAVDEIVSCVAKSSRLRGVLDDYDFEGAGHGVSDEKSESEDEASCASESGARYQSRKKPRRKKSKEQKKKEMEERKAAVIKQRQEAAGGTEWKGWIYLHPSPKCKWVKVGGTLQIGRSEGQASSTFGPDVVYMKFAVDLGSVADTSKRTAKRRLKQLEALVRLIFNRNHMHSRREVRPLLSFPVTQCFGCIRLTEAREFQ
jgi:hypothetical protein